MLGRVCQDVRSYPQFGQFMGRVTAELAASWLDGKGLDELLCARRTGLAFVQDRLSFYISDGKMAQDELNHPDMESD